MKTTKCGTCGDEFSYEPFVFMEKEKLTPTRCDKCILKERAEQDAKENNRRASFEWERLCPTLYRDTDIKRLEPHFQAIIANWQYGPKGIGFLGNPGVGKTRTALMILKKHLWLGKKCAAVSSTRFEILCRDQFSSNEEIRDAVREKIEGIRDADLLLLDDVGKGKMTERVELEFYDLLEHRTSWMKPTIWTANSDSDQLLASMSFERGESIMRRLSEFSEIV